MTANIGTRSPRAKCARPPLGLFAIAFGSLLGCGNDNPAATKEQLLLDTWNLRVVQDLDEGDFEFSYTFSGNGTVTNTIGGEILAALRNIDELDADLVDELDKLKGIDGGVLQWRGTWTTLGDSLDMRFDSMVIALIGRVPVVNVKLSVPVYAQELSESETVELGFRCSLTENELILRGRSLTAGVTPGVGAVDQAHTQALEGIGEEGVRLVSELLLTYLSDSVVGEFAFTRD